MGAGHDHGHAPPAKGTATAAYKGRLRIALTITLTVMVVEIVGGIVADSLALIADATHMATDALGLSMALLAIHFANRPPSENRTFGYARAEILAALANCLLLFGVGGYVLYEAVQRFVTPAETEGGLTMVFGIVGLLANLVSLALLMGGQKDSLNVRGAFLEVLADALGSVAVLVSAALILLTGWQAADPIASIVIGLMIVPRTWKLLRETLNVLLESAPRGVDMAEVRANIAKVEKATGKRPIGWSGPDFQETPHTPALLAAEGIRYVCDWGNDEQPYKMTPKTGELYALGVNAYLDDNYIHLHGRRTINEVNARLTTSAMIQMNRDVEVDGQDPAIVAERFLRTAGLLEGRGG